MTCLRSNWSSYVKKFYTWRKLRIEATRAAETTWRRWVFKLRSPKRERCTMAYCDGYDELLSANGHAEESLNSIEYRLQQMVDNKVSQICKAVDEIQLYGYQYNVKKVGMPQAEGTSESTEDTVKKCLDIFSGIGANGDWRYLLWNRWNYS